MRNYLADIQAQFEAVALEVEEWYRTDMNFKKLVDEMAQELADLDMKDEEARRGR